LKKEIEVIGWYQFEELCQKLVNQIDKKYDLIAGVTRGGLIPAVYISHRLKLPMIAMDKEERLPVDCRILVIDEIYDTGETLLGIMKKNPAADFGAIYHQASLPPLNYFGEKKVLDKWIVFPWEVL
jgi:hypothetical protein